MPASAGLRVAGPTNERETENPPPELRAGHTVRLPPAKVASRPPHRDSGSHAATDSQAPPGLRRGKQRGDGRGVEGVRSSPVVSPRQADISGERYGAWPSPALTLQRAGSGPGRRQLCIRTAPWPDTGSYSAARSAPAPPIAPSIRERTHLL